MRHRFKHSHGWRCARCNYYSSRTRSFCPKCGLGKEDPITPIDAIPHTTEEDQDEVLREDRPDQP